MTCVHLCARAHVRAPACVSVYVRLHVQMPCIRGFGKELVVEQVTSFPDVLLPVAANPDLAPPLDLLFIFFLKVATFNPPAATGKSHVGGPKPPTKDNMLKKSHNPKVQRAFSVPKGTVPRTVEVNRYRRRFVADDIGHVLEVVHGLTPEALLPGGEFEQMIAPLGAPDPERPSFLALEIFDDTEYGNTIYFLEIRYPRLRPPPSFPVTPRLLARSFSLSLCVSMSLSRRLFVAFISLSCPSHPPRGLYNHWSLTHLSNDVSCFAPS